MRGGRAGGRAVWISPRVAPVVSERDQVLGELAHQAVGSFLRARERRSQAWTQCRRAAHGPEAAKAIGVTMTWCSVTGGCCRLALL